VKHLLSLLKAVARRFSFIGFAAMSLSAWAAELTPLFSPAPLKTATAATLFRLQLERGVSRAKLVDVDFGAVDQDSGKSADSLAIDAFDGTTLVVDKERVARRGVGNYTWYGTVRGHPNGRTILTVVDGRIAGSITLADPHTGTYAIYELVPTNDGSHALKEIRQDALQTEEPGHFHAPLSGGKDATASAQADSGDVIDVLVVFSNQTAAAVGTGIGAQVQAAIDNTNQVYANSGINQRLRLVHYEQVNYDEHGTDAFSTALTDVTNAAGGMASVPGLRNAYGADLVSVFIENGGYCGIAWIGPSAAYGFSVVNRGCTISNNSFAHELGHNMGALHDPYQDPTIRPFTYGHGYVNLGGRFRTVMAYNDQCAANGFSCTRVPYMSNPNLTLNGFPLGTAQNDPSPTSNVARVLNETAFTVANFRQTVVGGCSYSINPTSVNSVPESSTGSTTVTSGSGCAWTATSNAGFLTVTAGSSGSGNGGVNYSVAANSGPARSGTLAVAGVTFTVNQASGCTFALGATSANVNANANNVSTTVTAAAGCPWIAASNAGWLTITSGASGSGNGLVSFAIAQNSGSARSGTLTIAGQTFTVNQSPSASYSVSTTSLNFDEQNAGSAGWPQTVTFTNAGATTLTINSLTMGGNNPADFTRSGSCASGSLGTGLSCTLVFNFIAPLTTGLRSATLSVVTSAGTSVITLSGNSVPYSLIVNYYQSALHRPPYGGTPYWNGEIARLQSLGVDAKETLQDIGEVFFAGSEYRARNTTSSGYVTDLYQALFNRAPDSGGLTYWTGLLAAGLPRSEIVLSLRFSAEFGSFVAGIAGNQGSKAEAYEVMDYYVGFLGRLPDSGGFNYWLAQFRSAQCAAGAPTLVWSIMNSTTSQFIASAEYVNRGRTDSEFVTDLYRAMMRRDGGASGVSYWTSRLAGGMTREQVRQAFAGSSETIGRANAIAAQGCLGT